MIRKRVLVFVVVLVQFLVGTTAAFGAVWKANEVLDKDIFGVNLVESNYNSGFDFSRIDYSQRALDSNGNFHDLICTSVGKSPCDDPKLNYTTVTLLPLCDTPTSDWCISSVSFVTGDKNSVNAKFIRSINSPSTQADQNLGLPKGGSISLWNAPGVKNLGGTETYAVYAYVQGSVGLQKGSFYPNDFRLMVLPYSIKSGSYEAANEKIINYYGGSFGISTPLTPKECAWVEVSACGLQEDFAPNTQVNVSLHIGNSLTGWLMGRLASPDISVTRLNDSQNILEVNAQPVQIPKIYVTTKYSTATPDLRAMEPNRPSNEFGVGWTLSNSLGLIDKLMAWKDLAKDSASGLVTTWSVASTSAGSGSECLQSKSQLLGLVTTNAMAFEGQAPTFIDGELRYRVGGFHFNPDGTVFKGSYSLAMRSEVARCLYHFSNAPVKATIQITSENGIQEVATTVMNEQNSWINLSASGFTFSSPVVKVKLTQEAPTPLPLSAASTLLPNKPKTIVCRKGNQVRKVPSPPAKCPAGFRHA